MKASIERILEEYLAESQKPSAGNALAHFIRHDFETTVQSKAKIDLKRYKVQGSAGQGNWAKVPWLAVFDKDITTTAREGLYIVYLFRADMSGVYLSLNQGWTYFKNNYHPTREAIEKAVSGFRALIGNLQQNGFSPDNINLSSENTLDKGYELGHIYGKFYSKGKIPNDDVLVDDLKAMINTYKLLKKQMIYKLLKKQMNGKLYAEFLDELYKVPEILESGYEESYQKKVEKAKPNERILAILKNKQNKPEKTEEPKKPKKQLANGTYAYKRDPSIAKSVIVVADYTCEVDPSHITFTSEITNRNFVEAHHLIPMKFQDEFKDSLDVPANIVALCPNCHRKIHHAKASEKKEVLKVLFDKRKEELKEYGIEISFEKLLKFYT